MPEANSIQLQSVGDLISESFRLCRQNCTMIVKILLPALIGVVIARTCLAWGLTHLADSFFNALPIGLAGFIFLLWFSWLALLRQLTLLNIFILQGREAGKSKFDNFDRLYKEIKKRQLCALGILVLTVLAEIVALVVWVCALVLIGIAAALILGKGAGPATAIILGVFGVLSFILAAAVFGQFMGVGLAMVAIEPKPFGDYLKESLRLIFADLGRAVGFAMLLGLSIYLLTIPLTIPITAYSMFIAFSHSLTDPHFTQGPLMKQPTSVLVLTEIAGGIISLVTWSIACTSYGTFYRDLTVRQYATDLLRRLDALIIGNS